MRSTRSFSKRPSPPYHHTPSPPNRLSPSPKPFNSATTTPPHTRHHQPPLPPKITSNNNISTLSPLPSTPIPTPTRSPTLNDGCPNPPELVSHLNNYIIGQFEAKRSVAIAVRDRWRRQQITDSELRSELCPSNILLVGPSGSGKTEIARRLATAINAPLVKAVATKFTEVGFVGENTFSMIEDLAEQAFIDERKKLQDEMIDEAKILAMDEVIKAYLCSDIGLRDSEISATRLIKSGQADDKYIEVDESLLINHNKNTNDNENNNNNNNVLLPTSYKTEGYKKRKSWIKIKVSDAYIQITEHFLSILTKDKEIDIKDRARKSCQERGIVFIDEFDKLIEEGGDEGSFRSKRRGVQKELLSLIEGTSVQTPRLGRIVTDHILFICSGAFTSAKISDIMPELQGRLPIRSELKSLSTEDLIQILSDVKYSIPRQHCELLKVEGVNLQFTTTAISHIAKLAFELNRIMANTGARRLQSIMAKLLEDIKFSAGSLFGQTIVIGEEQVLKVQQEMFSLPDLKKYVI